MNLTETKKQPGIEVKANVVDKLISFVSPVRAARRYKARAFMALAGGYIGASKLRRGLKQWNPFGYSADADILPDLPTLRERSRDLIRNAPLAAGAIATKVTNVVGTGLRLQSHIDRETLGLDDETADKWESKTEREWHLFWDSKECDAARTLNGHSITKMVYRQARENGDVFVVLPRIPRERVVYDLRLQIVEADRVCNKDNATDTETLSGGIRKDKYGAPVEYHILKRHPGNLLLNKTNGWDVVPAFGKTLGLRNVIHLFSPTRPGQTRGVPDLAPVIEPLKQLDKYTEAELMAAVISGMFTVFIESQSGENTLDLTDLSGETGSKATDDDYKLASGAIIGLAPGEKIHDSNPGRPNAGFDPFVTSILRQVGVALELPYEILIKHFTSSYSAARAALLEAWKYFISEREWLADNFNRVVYEIWMWEAVATGRIAAPGFLTDAALRQAYLASAWIGPAKGQIDELKEINAAEKRVGMGVSTLSEVTAEMTGGDWERKHKQSVKEHIARKRDGLLVEKTAAATEVREKEDILSSDDPLANTCIIPTSKLTEYLAKNAGDQSESKFSTTSPIPQPKEALKYVILDRKKDNVDWKKLYKEGNAHWADDMQPSKLAQDFAQKLVDKNKKSILEIGCGGGRDSILFALAGLDVTAIDVVPEAIEIAKENAKKAGVEINFQVGSAEKLIFENNAFDAVFTLSVLHSTDMGKSLPEVQRVLKKEGLSLIYIYSTVEKIDGSKKEFVSVNEYVDLLKKNGFKILDIYTTMADDEFDEAGEKHLIIIAEVKK